MPINQAQTNALDELIAHKDSDYLGDICESNLEKGVIHLFLERAITQNRPDFLKSLDSLAAKLGNHEKKLPLISAFKTLNDLHTNSQRSLDGTGSVPSLEFHFKQLQDRNTPVDVAAFQKAIRDRLLKVMLNIEVESPRGQVMVERVAFEEAERAIRPDTGWRAAFTSAINVPAGPDVEPTWDPYGIDHNYNRQRHENPLRQDAGIAPPRADGTTTTEPDARAVNPLRRHTS